MSELCACQTTPCEECHANVDGASPSHCFSCLLSQKANTEMEQEQERLCICGNPLDGDAQCCQACMASMPWNQIIQFDAQIPYLRDLMREYLAGNRQDESASPSLSSASSSCICDQLCIRASGTVAQYCHACVPLRVQYPMPDEGSRSRSPFRNDSELPVVAERRPVARAAWRHCERHKHVIGVDQEVVDACRACRLASTSSALLLILTGRAKKYKEITSDRGEQNRNTPTLKRYKELELIAQLNREVLQGGQELEVVMGPERYAKMMRKIQKKGGILPPLPWIR